MASPTKISVAVRLKNEEAYSLAIGNKQVRNWRLSEEENEGKPGVISYGYELYSTDGPGQDATWQNDPPPYHSEEYDEWQENLPVYVGYRLADTWNGIIELNQTLMDAIDAKKSELRQFFPNEEILVVVAGGQT